MNHIILMLWMMLLPFIFFPMKIIHDMADNKYKKIMQICPTTKSSAWKSFGIRSPGLSPSTEILTLPWLILLPLNKEQVNALCTINTSNTSWTAVGWYTRFYFPCLSPPLKLIASFASYHIQSSFIVSLSSLEQIKSLSSIVYGKILK